MPKPPRRPSSPITSTAALAKYLELSEWTVSRAINGHPEVKVTTRERILRAMDDLGFRPNPVARGLNGKKMGIVGVCFGSPRNTLMIDKIALLDEFLRSHQLRPLLAISRRDAASERHILEDFRHLRVDGVVLVQSSQTPESLRKILGSCPCIHVDPGHNGNVPHVRLDRGQAMEMIVAHLVGLGHRRFAALGFSTDNPWRGPGLLKGIRDHGLDPDLCLKDYDLDDEGESYAQGIAFARRALAEPKVATAWIVLNDRMAVGAIQAVRDAGLRVPEDISIVGFDNLKVGQHLHPALTTIDQLPGIVIRQAGEILLRSINQPEAVPNDQVVVMPQLIVRASTGPAPSDA